MNSISTSTLSPPSSAQTFGLNALSPLDGRYQQQTTVLQDICSEAALMRWRVLVEIEWFKTMISTTATLSNDFSSSGSSEINLSASVQNFLDSLAVNFSITDAARIKEIEATTNHDIKAIEYFIKEKIAAHPELALHSELVHFGCTSEDINNLAYALMIKEARDKCLLPQLEQITTILRNLAHTHAATAMLARTHGQPASPTTVGKEFANFVARLQLAQQKLAALAIKGKFNSTTGNYNALCLAYPECDWPTICQDFVTQKLKLTFNPYTTQIEPHDYIVEFCHSLAHINSILLDLARDIWSYIAINYFGLKSKQQEVGSSAMPHKINPIDFENAEGNLGLANALLYHFATKLPISRWQRDLSDSTVLRNLGASFAYSLIAYQALQKGLLKLEVNYATLATDLDQHWEVLAEAIQTVMRRYHIDQPYEKLKSLTRGQKIDAQILHEFINTLALPTAVKHELLTLTPQSYFGLANELAQQI